MKGSGRTDKAETRHCVLILGFLKRGQERQLVKIQPSGCKAFQQFQGMTIKNRSMGGMESQQEPRRHALCDKGRRADKGPKSFRRAQKMMGES